ncbi:long-chain fatty acid--CoA ligase [Parashewanella curva]|uniref:Long-chain fatty acid--CoA ligase n=1 Tax=Parashewanella curva TaxID=2338552 RepID=A0A3L8PVD4_9GAMM|nr:class I adenylate-forming enzyme family protein [Parashewanella curva]RLV58022.1 long-chain fatty acid--CoA ligase [Parashewanella curva]
MSAEAPYSIQFTHGGPALEARPLLDSQSPELHTERSRYQATLGGGHGRNEFMAAPPRPPAPPTNIVLGDFHLQAEITDNEFTQAPHFAHYPPEIQNLLRHNPNPEQFLLQNNLTSVSGLWEKAILDNPDIVAFTGYGKGHNLTYRDLDIKSSALAADFQSKIRAGKIRPNGNVLIALPSSPEFMISVLGALRAGLTPTVIIASDNQTEFQPRLLHAIRLTQPDTIIGSKIKGIHNAIVEVKEQLVRTEVHGELPNIMASMNINGAKAEFSPKKMQLYFSGLWGSQENRSKMELLKSTVAKKKGLLTERTPQSHSFHDVIHSKKEYTPIESHTLSPEEQLNKPALMLFTSGTTSVDGNGTELPSLQSGAKAAVYTNKMLLTSGISVAALLAAENPDMPKHPVSFFPLPLAHAFGALQSVLLSPLQNGCTHLVLNPRNPKFVKDAHEKGRANMLFGVEKFHAGYMSSQSKALQRRYKNSPATFVITGASAPKESTIDKAQRVYGTPMQDGYGSTETVVAIAVSAKNDPKGGLIPIPWVTTLVVPTDAVLRNEFDPNDIKAKPNTRIQGDFNIEGQLLVRGNIIDGYLHNVQATKSAFFVDSEGHQWFATGDLVRQRQDGRFKIFARSKETIIKGGENISPDTVEQTLKGLAGVEESLIFRFPQDLANQAAEDHVMLAIRVSDNSISKQDILDHMERNGASRAERPRLEHIIILREDESLQITHTLKPKRVQLTNKSIEFARERLGESIETKPNAPQIEAAVRRALRRPQ